MIFRFLDLEIWRLLDSWILTKYYEIEKRHQNAYLLLIIWIWIKVFINVTFLKLLWHITVPYRLGCIYINKYTLLNSNVVLLDAQLVYICTCRTNIFLINETTTAASRTHNQYRIKQTLLHKKRVHYICVGLLFR